MKLLLGICVGENVPSKFLVEFWRLMQPDPLPMVMGEGLHIAINRNHVVKSALQYPDWERLLFIDSDMLFSENLREIAESWEDPIVGGLYFRRRWPDFNPIPGYIKNPDHPLYQVLEFTDVQRMVSNPGLHPVDVLGTGCMGIRRDVLEMWAPDKMPWFDTAIREDGQEIIGEDVMFCHRATQQGIQLMVDTRIQCGHMGVITVGAETYAESYLAGELPGKKERAS